GERREALRLLLVARRSAVDVRREALGQLRGIIVTAPDRLREELRVLPTGRLLERCSRLRRSSTAGADELATRLVLRSLARRIAAASREAAELEREILAHVRALAPALLDEPGVGPIVAAQLIVAWSHRGRVRSEAAFARLAGVAPVPASSGQTRRHRLSRGGDRQLNRALHTIVLHRRQHDPATRDYIAKRVAEGKSRRDATRLPSAPAPAPLAGLPPAPAPRGQTRRPRLSRGGDRQLNRALHTILLPRRQHDPATRDYIAKRVAEGKSRRDATRLLKRYLARHLYRLLQNQEPLLA